MRYPQRPGIFQAADEPAANEGAECSANDYP